MKFIEWITKLIGNVTSIDPVTGKEHKRTADEVNGFGNRIAESATKHGVELNAANKGFMQGLSGRTAQDAELVFQVFDAYAPISGLNPDELAELIRFGMA